MLDPRAPIGQAWFARVSRRYARGSIVVTSNRSVEQWGRSSSATSRLRLRGVAATEVVRYSTPETRAINIRQDGEREIITGAEAW